MGWRPSHCTGHERKGSDIVFRFGLNAPEGGLLRRSAIESDVPGFSRGLLIRRQLECRFKKTVMRPAPIPAFPQRGKEKNTSAAP
jgi:hypothetical protein